MRHGEREKPGAQIPALYIEPRWLADIQQMLRASAHLRLARNIAAPARCSKPVIVANRGFCFGVGFEISLACDFRVATARRADRGDDLL